MDVPVAQVLAGGVADDGAALGIAGVGAGGDQHVPPTGVFEDVGVAPGFVRPGALAEAFVPAAVGLEDEVGVLGPGDQVRGGCAADALYEAVLGPAHAGVEHAPASAGVADDGAGPGREVVERRGVGGRHCVGGQGPLLAVPRGRVSDGRTVVAAFAVLQGARGAEEEQVVVGAVVGHPTVPDPVVGKGEAHQVSWGVRQSGRDRRALSTESRLRSPLSAAFGPAPVRCWRGR